MAPLPVLETAVSGYRLLAANPLAAVIWVALNLAAVWAVMALAMAVVGPNPSGGQEDLFSLLDLGVSVAVGALITAAASRAMLPTDKGGLGFLRLGRDELRLLAVAAFQCVLLIAAAVLAVVLGTVGMVFGGPEALRALSEEGPWTATALWTGALFSAPVIVLFVVLNVKLSLAAAQTVAEQRIRLFASWTLTRGSFWRLLAAYLLAGIPLVVITLAAVAAAAAVRSVSFMDSLSAAFAISEPASLAEVLSVDMLIALLPGAVFSALFMPALAMPAAFAYLHLAPTSRVEDVF